MHCVHVGLARRARAGRASIAFAGLAQEVRSIAVYSRPDAFGREALSRVAAEHDEHREGGAMTTGSIEGSAHGARSAYLSAASVPPSSTARVPASTIATTTETATRGGVRSVLALAAFIGIAALVAAFGSLFSGPAIEGWYDTTAKPMWNPPNWVFGPVWTVLYTSMSIAAWLVWRRADSDARSRALRMYVVQLAINAVWTPAFFGLGALFGAPGLWVALVVIVILDFVILAAIIRFGDVSRTAAALLIPYWFWALFATTLNAAIAVLAR